MAAYRRVDDLQSPAGWLPVHRDQIRAQRCVASMESLYLYLFSNNYNIIFLPGLSTMAHNVTVHDDIKYM